jgi:hypothetical protein
VGHSVGTSEVAVAVALVPPLPRKMVQRGHRQFRSLEALSQ